VTTPETNFSRELKRIFDVLPGDGGHLEFTVSNTGWGKSLAERVQRKSEGKGPDPNR
jgi:hypothetical protein